MNDETVTTHDSNGQVVPLNIRAREIMDPVMDELTPALPATIKPEKFQAAFVTAVVNNPEILNCKPSSIRTALMKCAVDGLVPDGRKAALVPFKGMAQYIPMTGGIIDRAAEMGDAYSFTAECVCERDEFTVNLADPNETEHRFNTNVFADRGDIIGAYCIFRDKDGRAIHRELMSRDEIEKAREVSRMKNAGPWTKWYSEMVRKTVIRRGSKYIPMSSELRRIIERDDEQTDFSMRNVTPDNYNPLTEAPNELEQAIDATAEEVPDLADQHREELAWVLEAVEQQQTADELHVWRYEYSHIVSALHPDLQNEARKFIADKVEELQQNLST